MNNVDSSNKLCLTCNKKLPYSITHSWYEKRKYCNNVCRYAGRKGYKHSEETKAKIAISNAKPFTSEIRKKRISDAKKQKFSQNLIKRVKDLCELRYVTFIEISRITGLKHKKLKRLMTENEITLDSLFLPSDMTKDEAEKIIQLAKDDVHYRDISQSVDRYHKVIIHFFEKLGIKFNRRKRSKNITEYSTEKFIRELLENESILHKQWYVPDNTKWEFDFLITGTNLLVEVQGDYYHCNPDVYSNGPINELQLHSKKRDKLKARWVDDNGYQLICIWEKEIREKNQKALELFIGVIKNAINNK
jgi:very-short-patch-repair endonuclease